MTSDNTHSTTTHSPTNRRSRSSLVRTLLLGGLLLGAVGLTGCSSSSYFVYRDSWGYGRHRDYHHESFCDDWGRGWDHDRGGHGYRH